VSALGYFCSTILICDDVAVWAFKDTPALQCFVCSFDHNQLACFRCRQQGYKNIDGCIYRRSIKIGHLSWIRSLKVVDSNLKGVQLINKELIQKGYSVKAICFRTRKGAHAALKKSVPGFANQTTHGIGNTPDQTWKKFIHIWRSRSCILLNFVVTKK